MLSVLQSKPMVRLLILTTIFLQLTSFASSLTHSEVDPIISQRISHNNLKFRLLDPFLLHPSRAGKRDEDKIYFPKNYDQNKKWPLVILLHGIYVSGRLQDQTFQLKNRVSSHGFILLIPGSTYDQKGMRFWNATNFCCDFFETRVDDVAYLENLILKIKNEYSVDEKKISLIGHSNGAMMAQRLACDTELISKVATYAGVLDASFTCKNKGHLDLALNHDQDDNHILYQGMSDEEFNYRKDNNKFYPVKDRYVGAVENYLQWKKVLRHGSVVLKTTRGQGHIPRLSPKDKDQLVEFLIR